MKNPFVKEDNSAVIAAMAIGALTAGTIVYLCLTESGAAMRRKVSRMLKEEIKDKASEVVSKKTRIPKRALKVAADHVIK